MRRHGNVVAFVSGRLWLTAAVLAAACAPHLKANELSQTPGTLVRPAQTAAGSQSGPQSAQGQAPQNAETLARELAVTKRDLDVLLRLLNRACDDPTHAGQAADRETAELRKALQQERDRAEQLKRDLAATRSSAEPKCAPATRIDDAVVPSKLAVDEAAAELRKSLQQEHDRASRLEQDLATARREVETQTALATKASAEATQQRKTADASSADLRKTLQQEQDRAGRLEQDLETARRDIEKQTGLATKAAAEASQQKKTADASSADLRKSLQQEHDRAGRLEQDLAAARRDVETQTTSLTKATAEADRLKKVADAGSADLRKSLQQERDRASRLEQDLATSRRDVETQTALAAKASEQVNEFKKADAGSAGLRKSLQQERDRASRLEQDLATSRRDVETQTALAAKASEQLTELKKADAGAADLRKSLQQEHERASRLEQDLATSRRDVETQTALAAKASEQVTELTKADAGSADLRKSLQQERDRASRLEQDLAASRRDVETQTALAAKASEQVTELKKADAGSADLRKSLQQEHERASRLEQDLATSRRDVETQTILAAKATAEASQLKKAVDAGSVDLGKSLQQERERASRLEQDLAAAKRDVEAQTALATKAAAEASQLKKTADASSADLRKSLQEELARASRAQQDLATARRDVETQTALATKAAAEASQLKKTADASSADLRKALRQERERAAELERDLAMVRSNASASFNTQQPPQAVKPAAKQQTAVADTPSKPEDAAEIARLVAYARVLLGRGDIGSARIVLQRAADMGSAEASFTLAESYDPLILSKWGTYGTHGDASRALDLYARALAGGIKEAKERTDALKR
jgi:hypothetical protein